MNETVKRSALEQLLSDLRATYPDDPSAPGVVSAQVRFTPKPRFYVSAVRYRKPFGEGREVLMTERGTDLGASVRKLFQKFRGKMSKSSSSKPFRVYIAAPWLRSPDVRIIHRKMEHLDDIEWTSRWAETQAAISGVMDTLTYEGAKAALAMDREDIDRSDALLTLLDKSYIDADGVEQHARPNETLCEVEHARTIGIPVVYTGHPPLCVQVDTYENKAFFATSITDAIETLIVMGAEHSRT